MRLRDLIFVSVVLGGGLALARGVLQTLGLGGRASATAERAPGMPTSGPIVDELDAGVPAAVGREGNSCPRPRPPSWPCCGGCRWPSPARSRRWRRSAGSRLDRPDGRLEAWLDDLLRDRRSADYLAERFARALVGTEDGPFLLFRRRRFITWLSDAILANRPYDAIVRDLIADQGLWTDHPATNFVSVTFDPENERPDPERLAARVARAFLGRPARLRPVPRPSVPALEAGRLPRPGRVLRRRLLRASAASATARARISPLDRKTKETVKVEPRVPFHPELLPGRRATRASSSRPGSSTRATPTSPAPRSTASGPSSSAGRWSSRSTTCPSRASCPRRWSCSPTTSRRTATTCTA